MTITHADISNAQIIWDYMLLHHELKKSDVIFVLGVTDLRIAEYAVDLYFADWAPKLLFTGNAGWSNKDLLNGQSEADRAAEVARVRKVPEENILVENTSTNTGENFIFGRNVLQRAGITSERIIIVTKPYTERRGWATFKKQWPLPQPDAIVSSPPITLADYLERNGDPRGSDWIIHALVGDVTRIKEYPAQGFQIEQHIPPEVEHAHKELLVRGFFR